jgi:hypothetical protein
VRIDQVAQQKSLVNAQTTVLAAQNAVIQALQTGQYASPSGVLQTPIAPLTPFSAQSLDLNEPGAVQAQGFDAPPVGPAYTSDLAKVCNPS